MHRSLALACDRAGVELAISAYDLRHSAIILMIANGHPVRRVADWAGTSERMIWEVYRCHKPRRAPLSVVAVRVSRE